jgi:hypothetical protein
MSPRLPLPGPVSGGRRRSDPARADHPDRVPSTDTPISHSCGGMAERFKAAVLKTVGSERGPGVRIPLPPPNLHIFLTIQAVMA